MNIGCDAMHTALAALRQRLAALEPVAHRDSGTAFMLGHAGLDRHLGGGLAGGQLHEVHARDARDAAAACGFALALALRAAGEARCIVWVRHRWGTRELGGLYAPGLAEFGASPGRVILVAARDPLGALRAAHEALRCRALGAVLIEIWGEASALDLTASRRLMLTAARSGVTGVIARGGAVPRPSAAFSRWTAAGAPSMPLAAGATGHPAFDITLDRHRAGAASGRWQVEWNRDRCCLAEPAAVSGAVAAVPDDGPAASRGAGRLGRTG